MFAVGFVTASWWPWSPSRPSWPSIRRLDFIRSPSTASCWPSSSTWSSADDFAPKQHKRDRGSLFPFVIPPQSLWQCYHDREPNSNRVLTEITIEQP